MDSDRRTTRRRFLQQAAAAAPSVLSRAAIGGEGTTIVNATSCPGILNLRLHTRCDDGELANFYGKLLGLPVLRHAARGISIQAGGTNITFEPAATGEPYYHVAFNIPENKLAAAKAWLKPRLELIKRPDGNDEFDFRSWNAHAIYFLDPAGNILEFIARHSLNNAAEGEFSPRDILYASEIGVVVDDVAATTNAAKTDLGLSVFAGSQSDQFTAVGDDHRLLILVKRGRPWFSQEHRHATVFPTQACVRGQREARLTVGNLPYDIRQAAGD